jgi:hypothetical protein
MALNPLKYMKHPPETMVTMVDGDETWWNHEMDHAGWWCSFWERGMGWKWVLNRQCDWDCDKLAFFPFFHTDHDGKKGSPRCGFEMVWAWASGNTLLRWAKVKTR